MKKQVSPRHCSWRRGRIRRSGPNWRFFSFPRLVLRSAYHRRCVHRLVSWTQEPARRARHPSTRQAGRAPRIRDPPRCNRGGSCFAEAALTRSPPFRAPAPSRRPLHTCINDVSTRATRHELRPDAHAFVFQAAARGSAWRPGKQAGGRPGHGCRGATAGRADAAARDLSSVAGAVTEEAVQDLHVVGRAEFRPDRQRVLGQAVPLDVDDGDPDEVGAHELERARRDFRQGAADGGSSWGGRGRGRCEGAGGGSQGQRRADRCGQEKGSGDPS